MMNAKKILIVAGEASGDLHASKLVQSMLQQNSDLHFFGIGGKQMRAAGVEIIIDSAQLAVIGFTEILGHLKDILVAFRTMRKIIEQQHPDLVILVDYAGFNLRLAKIAKQRGCKVFYYISPQVWGSRQYRVKAIQRYVDQIAVVFPFEVEFYRRFGIDAKFVGHPLTDKVKIALSREKAQEIFAVKSTYPIVGLLPGSRRGEIKRLLPIMLKSAAILQNKYPDIQFILPLATTLTHDDLEPYLKDYSLNLKITTQNNYDAISLCDAAIVTSGTATLETALLQVPFALMYKVGFITYILGMIVMRTKYLGICNIIADKEVTREFLQYNTDPKDIANEIIKILEDQTYRRNMLQELARIKTSLQSKQVSDAASLALGLL